MKPDLKVIRGRSGPETTESALLLMLVKGVLHLSDELGITDWVSVMEPKLLQRSGLTQSTSTQSGSRLRFMGSTSPAIQKSRQCWLEYATSVLKSGIR